MDVKTEHPALSKIDRVLVGGMRVARLDLDATACLMIELARTASPARQPVYLTSANGEVLARSRFDATFATLIQAADLISADGQPLVMASRLLSRKKLPERVATSDLYPIVAEKAQNAGVSFYLLGATEKTNRDAYEATKRRFPRLDLRGHSHGYLTGEPLERKLDEINALAPDILWLGLGVPLEQHFVHRYAHRLPNVKIIKTSGGLFNFIAATKKRAPLWMQKCGLEWAHRLYLEPRRLFIRYLTTNPLAFYLLLTKTR